MKQKRLFLHPGDFFAEEGDVVFETILGSCVSILLISQKSLSPLVALSHALLPRRSQFDSGISNGRERMFVDYQFIQMMGEFERRGIETDEIEVRIYGGAELILRPELKRDFPKQSIGSMNVKCAMEMVAEAGMVVSYSDCGGRFGRNLVVNTKTRTVKCRKVERPEMVLRAKQTQEAGY